MNWEDTEFVIDNGVLWAVTRWVERVGEFEVASQRLDWVFAIVRAWYRCRPCGIEWPGTSHCDEPCPRCGGYSDNDSDYLGERSW